MRKYSAKVLYLSRIDLWSGPTIISRLYKLITLATDRQALPLFSPSPPSPALFLCASRTVNYPVHYGARFINTICLYVKGAGRQLPCHVLDARATARRGCNTLHRKPHMHHAGHMHTEHTCGLAVQSFADYI
jgi:hypothetical protein